MENVYEPADDSFLLERAVQRYSFGRTLDLGTGSGIQGIAAAKRGCSVTFSDISEEALETARLNAKSNGVNGNFVLSDLFRGIPERFNTIIFNPPYLPSKSVRVSYLDGGRDGREVIDRFLDEYRNHLLAEHVVLLLESSLNGYEKDVVRLNAEVVERKHIFFEDLVVLKFE